MSNSPLRLSNEDFWSQPERTSDDIAEEYVDAEKEVLLFDAPEVVDLDRRETAPTQVLRVATFSHTREKPFTRTAVIVATDLVNNVTQAALAIPPPTDETPPLVPPDHVSTQEGISVEAVTIDLRETLSLPWEPGRYLVRLILRDEITSPRLVELRRGAAYVDPEVERTRSQIQQATNVSELVPSPDATGVSYARDGETPLQPDGIGLNISLPRVCLLNDAAPCVLRGAFRLPLLRRHIVPPGSERSNVGPLHTQIERTHAPWPLAVVPITLVATGTATPPPAVWRLVLPVYDAIDESGEVPYGTGTFAIDMRHLQGFDVYEQTWFLYAFSAAAEAGPAMVGLTQRPRTP